MIAPREKLDTQFLLKIGNLAEKRWLSDVQLICRMSEIFLSGDAKNTQALAIPFLSFPRQL